MQNKNHIQQSNTDAGQAKKRQGLPLLKICGQNLNIQAVANLQPDYLGFIFWEPSSRYFNSLMPAIDTAIKRAGVFVDASIANILEAIDQHQLQAVQLHGQESVAFCQELQTKLLGKAVEIIKVFAIKDSFNFAMLTPYEDYCDFFLFDTKGKLPGGNGYVFNWEILKDYPSTKPYFLSGGIGLENIDALQAFLKTPQAQYCYAIDINSKFEDQPGLKNIKKLQQFIHQITDHGKEK